MKVHSVFREYEAIFCGVKDFLTPILSEKRYFFIIDKLVYKLYEELLAEFIEPGRYYLLEATENKKTVNTALEIVDTVVQLETKKNTILIAIGGGIVEDVTCFVASVLYRGVDWYYIPTTLLAQTDSCIGSKSSLNYGKYKNLIGTFYPPLRIGIDFNFINTLTDKDYKSGIGEIVKIAVMQGENSFYRFKELISSILIKDFSVLRSEIEKTLEFKKNVIEIDEFDNNYRNIMNYGHTFGHAFESVSGYIIPHGQGVMMGMLTANEISFCRGLITDQYRNDMCTALIRLLSKELIRKEFFDAEVVISAMKKDKKYLGGKHSCILIDENEAFRVNDVSNEEVMFALKKCSSVFF